MSTKPKGFRANTPLSRRRRRADTDSYLIEMPEGIVDDRDIAHFSTSRHSRLGGRSLPEGIASHRRTALTALRTTATLQTTAIAPPRTKPIDDNTTIITWIYELSGDAVVEEVKMRSVRGVNIIESLTVLLYLSEFGEDPAGGILFTRQGGPPMQIDIDLVGLTERQDSGFDYIAISADQQPVARFESIGVGDPENYDPREESLVAVAASALEIIADTGDPEYNDGVFWRATIRFDLSS